MKKIMLGAALVAATLFSQPAVAAEDQGMQAIQAFSSYAATMSMGALLGDAPPITKVIFSLGAGLLVGGAFDVLDGKQSHFGASSMAAGIGTITVLRLKF